MTHTITALLIAVPLSAFLLLLGIVVDAYVPLPPVPTKERNHE